MKPTWNDGTEVKIGDYYRPFGAAEDDIRQVKEITYLIDGWRPETLQRIKKSPTKLRYTVWILKDEKAEKIESFATLVEAYIGFGILLSFSHVNKYKKVSLYDERENELIVQIEV